jgi:hypothetical protein
VKHFLCIRCYFRDYLKVYSYNDSVDFEKQVLNSFQKVAAMPLVIEAIFVSLAMMVIFGLAFVLLFIFALTLAPIERGLSEYIWSHTNPPKPKAPVPAGSFKDFSRKH